MGTVVGAGSTYYFAVQQSRLDRFENSLMAEYQAVAASKRELYAAVDKFTAALAVGRQPDPSVVQELNSKLLDLHQRIDAFSLGLSEDDRAKISEVQKALADVKVEAAQAKSKTDLEYFTGRLAQFEIAYRAARPIVEKKIGTPDVTLSG
ncbi:hypothetical protein [Rhizobium rosettiformans]|uniref:hypothetical protein n=1 Tax=Rhizobium rosettiformans TaxID=1368430 RepID=UPI002859D359|nr:hypothetical protein [Rhizobium rosettiformans]MDR7029829.1 hypothetical protein [Rhizobium rosettiformans]